MADTIIHRRHIVYGPTQVLIRIIWTINGVIETLLGLKFVLELFGANPAAVFTNFIYAICQPLVAPFNDVFRSISPINIANGIWDWAPLIGIVVYSLIAWGLVELLSMSPTDTTRVDDIETKS